MENKNFRVLICKLKKSQDLYIVKKNEADFYFLVEMARSGEIAPHVEDKTSIF